MLPKVLLSLLTAFVFFVGSRAQACDTLGTVGIRGFSGCGGVEVLEFREGCGFHPIRGAAGFGFRAATAPVRIVGRSFAPRREVEVEVRKIRRFSR